ncbi:O-acetyl-ADP-ribose deacetylase [Sphingobacterium endophyticum]|uniref:O-acetyl-ADP-ribose deacetylase n=1 Tax=Sphingobacterium endophyticum TaxID=2546448 RepID=UPI0012E2C0A8|nr:O-acetyl-ADP-ribose deacetylase [Sphingobacterium endophyticum]
MNTKIDIKQGDITKSENDAIVNAANTSLLGGGGVDGAIHRAGGKAILEECQHIRNRQGGCKTGEAVITNAGNLKSKYVIHAVGPVWKDGSHHEDELLYSAYHKSLKLASKNNLKTIAFPNISTGIYGFPKDRAAKIAIQAVQDFLIEDESIDNVTFICFDDENYRIYTQLLGKTII